MSALVAGSCAVSSQQSAVLVPERSVHMKFVCDVSHFLTNQHKCNRSRSFNDPNNKAYDWTWLTLASFIHLPASWSSSPRSVSSFCSVPSRHFSRGFPTKFQYTFLVSSIAIHREHCKAGSHTRVTEHYVKHHMISVLQTRPAGLYLPLQCEHTHFKYAWLSYNAARRSHACYMHFPTHPRSLDSHNFVVFARV